MCDDDLHGRVAMTKTHYFMRLLISSLFISLSCFSVSSYRQACGLGIKMMRDITHLLCSHGKPGTSSFPCLGEVTAKSVTRVPCKCCVVWAFFVVHAPTHTHTHRYRQNCWDTFYSNKLTDWIMKGLSSPLSWDLQSDDWKTSLRVISSQRLKKNTSYNLLDFGCFFSFVFFKPQKGGKKETKGRFWLIW